jgi:dTDP-4-amino-4,6-dideoxygalactose transaminase
MCVTNDPALAARLSMIRVHGMEPKYYHQIVGGNFRIDELQAAVLVIKLKHLDDWSRGRQENACFYFGAFERAGLKQIITLPAALPGRHIYNQFVIRAPDRDALKNHLSASGVGSEIYYPVPLHRQQCFTGLGHVEGDFPESERAATQTLALPIYPELAREQLQYVVDCIARFFGKG